MTVPEPLAELKGHCSVIHNNTLFVFSSDGFQYIPLEENGKWKWLDPGHSVSDAVCVLGGVEGNEDEEALYVVGGTGNDDDATYSGLQRYSFQDKAWQTLGDTRTDLSDRTGHGAGYLKIGRAHV